MFEQTVQQIPIRHDVFSYLIAFGAFYGLVLVLVIAAKGRSNSTANILLGSLLTCVALVLADLFLGYTNLMKYVVHLNDSTESLVLMMFPLVYLIIRNVMFREPVRLRTHYGHFLAPLAYFLYQWVYFVQPREVKLNAHIGAFLQGEVDYLPVNWLIDPKWLWLKDNFRLMIYLVGGAYLFLGFRLFYRGVREGQFFLFKSQRKSKLIYVRNLIFVTLFFSIAAVIVYARYETDAGDHYLGAVLTYGVFVIGFFMLGESRIFEHAWLADKYETSGLKTDHRAILEKLRQFLAADPYYLDQSCSLKTLAQQLDIPANYLSQSINTELQQNFNDFINTYRIETAQRRLLDPEYRHLNIEGIGYSVGFKSKSAFYTAFKKQTRLTPSQYINGQQAKG